ncbi:MAG TPA: S8 family serine peptidase [Candidatus Sulfopaludibacter sp.]|jgi:hypothetical protein|nr:S8 family serine peptidase [Candidatus Sulfopaludibacter sp.]
MARKWHMSMRGLLLLALVLSASAQDQFIVRIGPGQIKRLATQYGFTVGAQLPDLGNNVYVITAPANSGLGTALAAEPAVQSVEPDQLIKLPKKSGLTQPAGGKFTGQSVVLGATPAPTPGYFLQPAAATIGLDAAHAIATGAGTVAFLDTGVDFNNTILFWNLVPGTDLISPGGGIGQDISTLDQSTTSILDSDAMIELSQSTTSILDYSGGSTGAGQSTTSILDQSTTSILDDGSPLSNAYGHGTMVAGVIHMVAPTAMLMPVKVFGNDGTANLSTLLEGFYWAMNHGARVINMSFSMAANSPEFQRALQTASSMGIISVASVGNDGQQSVVYPAAYSNVIGVASTDNAGVRSSFSNYGSVVSLAAPGEEILTTFPGNRFAAGWGTSFSAPMVSGAAALLVQINGQLNLQTAANALLQADPLGQGLGAGELDLVKALQYALGHGGNH